MPLPKINTPSYELFLPLSKKTIKYRPFLVKEEKILLIARESNDESMIINAIKQIINNCCLTKLDIEKLPILDLEYLFLNLRAKSVGEIVELQYKCNNNIEKETGEVIKCGHVSPIIINLLEISPKFMENHSNKIELDENIGIVMKYPVFNTLKNVSENKIETLLFIIYDSIDYIYDNEEIYYSKDISTNEIADFVGNLNSTQFNKIKMFFDTMPKLFKEVNFSCKKCGYKEIIKIEGIQSFFG